MWSFLVFFAWVIWFWLLISVFSDLFRRHDISGLAKTGWIILVIVLPYVGVFIYLLAEHDGMAQRTNAMAQAQQQQFDSYVKSVATEKADPAAQIANAKSLLDSGAITQDEFDALKKKALAS
jgi:ABC-type transport system involved in cytochrome bd biosynthesis fused ATPase/permease subunit